MINLSNIYKIKNRLRGKASQGFVRPTIKEFFMSAPNFMEIIANLKVGSSETVNPSGSDFCTVTKLTSTKVVITYRNQSASYRTEARILTIDGTNITVGDATVIITNQTHYTAAAALTDSIVVLFYRDQNNSYKGTVCVLEISGDTITTKLNTSITNSSIFRGQISRISDTKAALTYTDHDDSRVKATVIDVTATTLVIGPIIDFLHRSADYPILTVLSANKVLIACKAATVNMALFNVSDNTLSVVDTFDMGFYNYFSGLTRITDTKAVYVYSDTTNNNKTTAVIIDIVNDVIVKGDSTVLSDTYNTVVPNLGVTAVGNNKAVVLFRDDSNAPTTYINKVVLMTVGSTITARPPIEFKTGLLYYPVMTEDLDGSTAVIGYADSTDTSKFKAHIIYNI